MINNCWREGLLLPVFNNGVCVFDFDRCDDFMGKKRVDKAIDKLFNLPEVLNHENVPDASGGRALSTAHLHQTHSIPELLNFKNNQLGDWILRRIFESATLLGFNETRDIKRFKYHRTWANRMEKGCEARPHRHASDAWSTPHLVAIYYTQVPELSADLIFIDDDNLELMNGPLLNDYPDCKQHKIESKTGRLVCHDARDLHATNKHLSELPRTCLIIEVGFAPLP